VSRELLAQGREAEVYLQDDGTVLKLWLDPAHAYRAEREAAACRALAGEGLTPTVHERVTVDGRPGLVMDRIEGDSLLAQLERSPQRLFTAARVLAETQASLHERTAPGALPDLKENLAERIAGAEPLPDDLRAEALRVLDALPTGDRLCHGDFHLGNMLGTWDAPVLIDWGVATRGDPVADIARSDLLHRIGTLPPGTSAIFRGLASVGRRVLTDRYVHLCRRHRPLEHFDRWRYVQWAARFFEDIPEEHPTLLRLLRRARLE
jgi:aminoglycoside phosphotransferase (APT) family kinase protein